MATATKIKLSGSTDGERILVSQTATLGNTIHATGTGLSTVVIDEISFDLANVSAAAVLVTIEWGGVAAKDIIKINLDPYEIRSFTNILAGTGSAANTLSIFAATTNVVTVGGWVDRYTL